MDYKVKITNKSNFNWRDITISVYIDFFGRNSPLDENSQLSGINLLNYIRKPYLTKDEEIVIYLNPELNKLISSIADNIKIKDFNFTRYIFDPYHYLPENPEFLNRSSSVIIQSQKGNAEPEI